MTGDHTGDRHDQTSQGPRWWELVGLVAFSVLAVAVSFDLFW